MTKKIVLTDSAKAALASGAALADVMATVDPNLTAEGDDTGTQDGPAATPIDPETDTDAGVQASDVADASGSDAAPAPASDGLTAYLQATVDKQSARIESLLSELNSTKTELAELKGIESVLRPVVVTAVQKLQVAVGQKPTKHEGVSATALADYYGSLMDELNERIPTGRRSLETTDDSRQQNEDFRVTRLRSVDGKA